MLFCRPAPAARGSLPVSKPHQPLSGKHKQKHKLAPGRFPPPSNFQEGYHHHHLSRLIGRIKRTRRLSPRLWATNCCSGIVFAFSALKSEAEAEPAHRDPPIASRSSPFGAAFQLSTFQNPIFTGLRHCFYLANPQIALVVVLPKLKACARLHACMHVVQSHLTAHSIQ
jgi:hypothetical protein